MSGTALAAHAINPSIHAWGAEPEGAADVFVSLQRGSRIAGQATDTICDGLHAELSDLTFNNLSQHLESVLLASEDEIVAAMRLTWERLKTVIESSCAVPLAAILRNRELLRGRRVGVILSGGNVGLDTLPWSYGSSS